MLAQAWSRKMQYFYDIYVASAEPAHVFTEAEILAYVEPEHFSEAFGGIAGKGVSRLRDLRALKPQ